MLSDLSEAFNIEILRFDSYSVFREPYQGLVLNLPSAYGRENHHAIFNVVLDRQRTTDSGLRGQPLPAGDFRIPRRFNLYKFWERNELPLPRHLSEFNRKINQLQTELLFAPKDEIQFNSQGKPKVPNTTLNVLRLEHRDILNAVNVLDKKGVTDGQQAGKQRGMTPGKNVSTASEFTGVQAIPNACFQKHETSQQEESNQVRPLSSEVTQQTTEEWLSDYRK